MQRKFKNKISVHCPVSKSSALANSTIFQLVNFYVKYLRLHSVFLLLEEVLLGVFTTLWQINTTNPL